MTAALRKISGNEVSEALFSEADKAVADAKRSLRSGKKLQKKDSKYAAYAREVTKRLAEADRKIAERRIDVAVYRQKSELRQARLAMSKALGRLSKRRPEKADFDEARTAVTVVQKTSVASETLAAKDRKFAAYVDESKREVRAAKRKIDDRDLEVAIDRQRERVNEALGEMVRSMARLPGPKEVGDAVGKIDAVDKTLVSGQVYTAKDRKYRQFHAVVAKRIEKARARIVARRDELAFEAQKAGVSGELGTLKEALADLDGVNPDRAVASAEKALAAAKRALKDGVALEGKLRVYRAWAAQARKTLAASEVRLGRRKLEMAVNRGQGGVEQLLSQATAAVGAALQRGATSADVAKAVSSVKSVRSALAKESGLEKRDKKYRDFASTARTTLTDLEAQAEQAKHLIAFRSGPIAAMSDGISASGAAAQKSDLGARRDQYKKAIGKFQACRKASANMIGDHPKIAKAVVFIENQQTPAKDIIKMCADQEASAKKKLSAVQAILTFHSGPAKSYETGKRLLGSDKGQALKSFERCLSSGKILLYKHPELKEKKLSVAGTMMTLPELIDACQTNARKLRGK